MKVYNEYAPTFLRSALNKANTVYDATFHHTPRSDWNYVFPKLVGRIPRDKYPRRESATSIAKEKYGPKVQVVAGCRYWGVYVY